MTSSVTEKASPIWRTLPSRYYWAEDIYELEKERIFYDSWLYVGRVAQIPNPGDFITQDIVDESVISSQGQARHHKRLLQRMPTPG